MVSKYLILIFVFMISGCATKYILPGNRFITPETQGDALHGQIEVQKTAANLLAVSVDDNDAIDGVEITEVFRTGFLYSTSFFDSFDFVWTHTGSGNSLLGGKFQIIGPPRIAKGAGHKLAVLAAFGGNEYETDDKSVKFNLTGQEYMLLYGYRMNEFVLGYSSFSYSTYVFDSRIKSSIPALNGAKAKFDSTLMGLYIGVELSYELVFLKLESGYQQLSTTDTKDFSHVVNGLSVGMAW